VLFITTETWVQELVLQLLVSQIPLKKQVKYDGKRYIGRSGAKITSISVRYEENREKLAVINDKIKINKKICAFFFKFKMASCFPCCHRVLNKELVQVSG
jgi:hypothetical protein